MDGFEVLLGSGLQDTLVGWIWTIGMERELPR